MKPFLIRGVGLILRPLSSFSLFEFLLSIFKVRGQDVPGLTELWVLSNIFASILLLKIMSASSSPASKWLVSVYAAFRLLEVVTFQFYTQIYGGYRGAKPTLRYTINSYRRSIVLALLLYVESIIWFAVLYRLGSANFNASHLRLDSFLVALYYSVVTMTTVGYGDISPKGTMGVLIVTTQALVGLFMTILVLARIISYIPKPETEDEAEK
jgi:hypothetical protein